MKKIIDFKQNEYWYGGAVNDGYLFPLSADDNYYLNIDINETFNQINPVFMSNLGRYIWLEDGGIISFNHGSIVIDAKSVVLDESGTNLKEASLNACRNHFMPSGEIPDERAFYLPQYCTWIAFGYQQNQENILKYAHSLISKGFKPGIFIIDCTWQRGFGDWEFDGNRFPDPKAMIKELKSLGFAVFLWLVPYVTFDTEICLELQKKGALLTNEDGSLMSVDWWDGPSAGLDLRTEAAQKWIGETYDRLVKDYGVDGFKLDGGDAQHFSKDYPYANEQNEKWISSCPYSLKEARACYKMGGQPVLQRLADKAHIWDVRFIKDCQYPGGGFISYGFSALLPNMLTQGITGYYYGCPDMVGGGVLSSFGDFDKLDYELVVRYCQASALMPMIQFSLEVWNRETDSCNERCSSAMRIRERFLPYIVELAKNASKTGEPIIRYMEYEYPHSGFVKVTDQFMLGDKFLVAPIFNKGETHKKVIFPKGKWKDIFSGEIYEYGLVEIAVTLDSLPIFEKL